jgi:hypothetical protein
MPALSAAGPAARFEPVLKPTLATRYVSLYPIEYQGIPHEGATSAVVAEDGRLSHCERGLPASIDATEATVTPRRRSSCHRAAERSSLARSVSERAAAEYVEGSTAG